MTDERDVLADGLLDMAVPAPAGLLDRVFARWLAVPSRAGEVFVAFSPAGVEFLLPAATVDHDAAAFARAYRDRFGRPLRPADAAPDGLVDALSGGRGGPVRLELRSLPDGDVAVLAAVRRIPEGEVRTYGWVAREAGRPGAAGSVAAVLARNPLPVLVPCHRVVTAAGRVRNRVLGVSAATELLRAEGAPIDEVAALARRGVAWLADAGTGVLCCPACAHARMVGADDRREFRTVADAFRAGFRPCPRCRPA